MKYIENALVEINTWEKAGPGFLSGVAGFILKPAEKAAGAMIPDGIKEAVGKAVEGGLSFLSTQTAKTLKNDGIHVSATKKSLGDLLATQKGKSRRKPSKKSLADQLEAADKEAQEVWNWHISYAVTEGAATGSLGIFGLAADIPALMGILIREIQAIACCYGYDPTQEREREYILRILQAGTATTVVDKAVFVVGLKQFEQILLKVAWRRMTEALAAKQISKQSLLAAIRQFAKTLGIQITKRKALQMIPVIGALVGGCFNGMFANDIGKAAYMNYRRRWIAEHANTQLEDEGKKA